MQMDEMYPVYSISDTSGDEAEVDEETADRWWGIQVAWTRVQGEMAVARALRRFP